MSPLDAVQLLLMGRGCWSNGKPEIREEISAQFDLTLDDADDVIALFASPSVTDVLAANMSPYKTIDALSGLAKGLRDNGVYGYALCALAASQMAALVDVAEEAWQFFHDNSVWGDNGSLTHAAGVFAPIARQAEEALLIKEDGEWAAVS